MIGSYYNSFDPENLSWDMDKEDRMILVVKYNGHSVMRLSLHEAIETAGYKNVMKHVRECNNTPWLHKWQKERMDEEIAILKGDK